MTEFGDFDEREREMEALQSILAEEGASCGPSKEYLLRYIVILCNKIKSKISIRKLVPASGTPLAIRHSTYILAMDGEKAAAGLY